jgi:hypothetical protein
MSGSNALAAAKRRRVEGASKPSAPVARPNNSQQRPQSQPKASASATLPTGKVQNPTNSNQRPSQNANVVLQKNQFSSDRMNQNGQNLGMPNDENSNNIFTIPPPPPGVNPIELLKVHHIFINKLASHLPPALETLGENFNTMSANCDNLNDRLEILEKNGGASNKLTSNKLTSNKLTSNNVSYNQDVEDQKKIELLNITITSLSKTFDDLNNNFSKLQTYVMVNELEHNKFKTEMSSKNYEFSKEIDKLKKNIVGLENTVTELRNSRNDDQKESKQELEQESKQELEQESKQELEQESKQELEQESKQELEQDESNITLKIDKNE